MQFKLLENGTDDKKLRLQVIKTISKNNTERTNLLARTREPKKENLARRKPPTKWEREPKYLENDESRT